MRAAIVNSDAAGFPCSLREQTAATVLDKTVELSIVRISFCENGRVNASLTKGCIIYCHGEIVVGKWLSSLGGQRSE